MERTLNEQLLDDLIVRQIHLLRFGQYLSNRLVSIVESSEEEVGRLIRDELRNLDSGVTTQVEWKTLLALADRIEFMRRNLWIQAQAFTVEQIDQLTEAELASTKETYGGLLPLVFALAAPPMFTLKQTVRDRPIQGAVVSVWFSTMRANDARKVRAALIAGATAGESAERIAARVVGSSGLRGIDGVSHQAKVALAGFAPTAVMEAVSVVRQAFAQANTEILTETEQFVAVLDSRTTAQCRSLDGQLFAPGKGPRPPLHFRCRSMRIAFLDAIKLRRLAEGRGQWKDQWLKIFGSEIGVPGLTASSLPPAMRQRYAQWANKAISKAVGPIPEPEVYQKWIAGLSVSVQNNILGRVRGELFRKGNLDLSKFVDYTGAQYSLADLAKLHPSAFKKAGLDPKSF